MNAVEINSLSKTYGKIQAVKNINLNVPEGTIYGLIGPNGAGKTTLIRALVGALKPDTGKIKVLGKDPLENKWELRKQIGYMPQLPALYGDISARQNIEFFGKAQNMPNLKQEVTDILKFVELEKRADDLIRTFSGGMQKRVSLACALIHKPKILFLDEPTAAVDPNLKQRSWELFKELAASGVTLFVSTHLMDEAMHCDMVTILMNGEIISVDTPENILNTGKTRIQIIKKGVKTETTIDSGPVELSNFLKTQGLDASVESITIEPQNLEEIILNSVKQKGG